MTRKPIMAGNWKMNMDHLEAIQLVQGLAMELSDRNFDFSTEVVVIPPFTDLRSVQTTVDGDNLKIKYGAQDVSLFESGAYTGEVSAQMLKKLGCSYVVVGHSERREYHNESDELVGQKAQVVAANGMVPIICCGEVLEIRKEGNHVSHVVGQVKAALQGFTSDQVKELVIAYEPVWAIGTGEVATPADAEEVCKAIRELVAALYDQDVADAIRILYGGSVNSKNVKELMAQPDVDGGLVGGASLKADEFAKIADYQNL
ncbi:triose-phosphate isomerase [Actinomycetaceae bacterium WB03_NA08]|uniref:Triosephosphate isomerase n=1 Tax=Scrofimicrobium canadense TaxID=2652290 RepID=A0A6N7VQG4_9ACTO|nr:triose-phosphate isomerase [Scrofimicrobium canadense]MSS83974.1 triose-phosphate isomerase [Scrofimicrobium canadense]